MLTRTCCVTRVGLRLGRGKWAASRRASTARHARARARTDLVGVSPHSAMRIPSAAASPSALRLVARVGLLYACASDVRPEWANLRASELSALLRARGVDTSGVFERAELLRLLAATPESGPAGQAAGEQPLPRVNDMPMCDVMDELDRRGVRFDVLANPNPNPR